MQQTHAPKQLTIGVVSTLGDPQLGTVINGVVEIIHQHGGRVINLAALEVYQWAVTTLLDHTHEAEQLGWVEHTNDTWACFGRWDGNDRSADGQLRVVGVYPHTPQQERLIGRRIPVGQLVSPVRTYRQR